MEQAQYKTPDGATVARPLYVIPKKYEAAYIEALSLTGNLGKVVDVPLEHPIGATAVLAAPDHLGSVIIQGGDEDTEAVSLDDFRPLYTPTNDEVIRALRGPVGPVGPMGAAGSPGVTDRHEIAELRDRIEDTERAVAAAMTAITEIVVKITPNTNQNKEQ